MIYQSSISFKNILEMLSFIFKQHLISSENTHIFDLNIHLSILIKKYIYLVHWAAHSYLQVAAELAVAHKQLVGKA